MNLKKSVKKMVLEAEAQINVLSILEAHSYLEDDKYVFIDLRDIQEVQKECIIPAVLNFC